MILASVPNRVYPMSEFQEVRVDTVRATTAVVSTATVQSGSFSAAVRAPFLGLSTTYTVPPSGSMGFGDLVLVTGSGGTSALLYVKCKSGSGNAIYSIACTYVSSGSA